MNIDYLSEAYPLCTCNRICTRQCVVCSSVTWKGGPCVKALWDMHIHPVRGSADMTKAAAAKAAGEAPGPDGVVCGYHCDAWTISKDCEHHYGQLREGTLAPLTAPQIVTRLTDDQLVERAIDMMEQGGMTLDRWQVQAMRAIFGTTAEPAGRAQ